MYDSIMSNHFAIPRWIAPLPLPPSVHVKLASQHAWRNLENKTSRARGSGGVSIRAILLISADFRIDDAVTSVIRAASRRFRLTVDVNDANALYSITTLAADKGVHAAAVNAAALMDLH